MSTDRAQAIAEHSAPKTWAEIPDEIELQAFHDLRNRAIATERMMIGSALSQASITRLRRYRFRHAPFRVVAEAMVALEDAGAEPNLVSTWAELCRRRDHRLAGGVAAIAELTNVGVWAGFEDSLAIEAGDLWLCHDRVLGLLIEAEQAAKKGAS